MQQTITLARAVSGLPTVTDFALTDAPRPAAKDGELLLRVLWLSIDPYLRALLGGRYLTGAPALGDLIPGHGIGEVIETRAAGFSPGDIVVGEVGWRQWSVVAASGARKIDPRLAPLPAWLGVLGIPGLTAWAGLRTIGKPQAHDVVLISAAAGAVGSLAGQLAKRAGARVVGINGSAEKNALCIERYGYDAALNYRDDDFGEALKRACPDGIDVYFDNVGGRILEAALAILRRNARVVLCGLIDQYNAATRPPGPNLGPVIGARASLTGLVVYDHIARFDAFIAEVAPLIQSGEINYASDIRDGIEQAPAQLIALLTGANRGKALVRVAELAQRT